VRDAAGVASPDADGASLLPLLRDPDGDTAPVVWREDLMLESHGHYGRSLLQRMLRWKNWKYVVHWEQNGSPDDVRDPDELYDLSADPYELRNLAADGDYEAILGQMRRRLAANMDRYGDDAADARGLRYRLYSESEVHDER
jgi:arylsulfatase A-like enzyme